MPDKHEAPQVTQQVNPQVAQQVTPEAHYYCRKMARFFYIAHSKDMTITGSHHHAISTNAPHESTGLYQSGISTGG